MSNELRLKHLVVVNSSMIAWLRKSLPFPLPDDTKIVNIVIEDDTAFKVILKSEYFRIIENVKEIPTVFELAAKKKP